MVVRLVVEVIDRWNENAGEGQQDQFLYPASITSLLQVSNRCQLIMLVKPRFETPPDAIDKKLIGTVIES